MKNRILIVDDNKTNVDIMKEILQEQYELEIAYTGEEALEKAPNFKPTIILLDIMMPGIDGYETCRRFRANPILKYSKILMVTARAMEDEVINGYDVGADDYITKPFNELELIAKVRVFLKMKFIEELDNLKDNLLRLLSHEIRTPLNRILGFSTLLQESEHINKNEQEYIQHVISSGNQLLEFAQKSLLLCKLQHGWNLDLHEKSVSDCINENIRRYYEKSLAEKIFVSFKDGCNENVLVDPSLMDTAISYILDNAIKFCKRDGAVKIFTYEKQGQFYIVVSDQGEGIDEAKINELFGKFTVNDLDHHKAGQGLSLTIAKRIMELHDGALLANNNEGEGATFSMIFPIRKQSTTTLKS